MTNIGIDEVLNRLSLKFNRIFYDRDFVGCVSEDLQTVIDNKNKCCVLVFPSLSPNYLRVVRYQAKLCDLAVISLGSGGSRSVAICQKKYFLPLINEKDSDKKEDLCSNGQMADNAVTVTKKKRPPIQLYIPPAQRKPRLSTQTTRVQNVPFKNGTELKNPRSNCDQPPYDHVRTQSTDNETTVISGISKLTNVKIKKLEELCYCIEDIDSLYCKKDYQIPYFSYQCKYMKFILFKDIFCFAKLLIFSIKRIKHSFHWIRWDEKNHNILFDDTSLDNWLPFSRRGDILKVFLNGSQMSLLVPASMDFRDTQYENEERLGEFQNSYCLCGNRIFFYLPEYMYYSYLAVPEDDSFHEELKLSDHLNCFQHDKSGLTYFMEDYLEHIAGSTVLPKISRTEDNDVYSLLVNKDRTELPQMPSPNGESNCDNSINNERAKLEITNEPHKDTSERIDRVIVLEKRIESPKTGSPTVKERSKQNEHEQEKEIMRKAKQNINRKTRPIIKYVGDDNDTLKIGKGDNINNWEDLFDEDGELQEDIFTGIVQKVGPEVTIVKASEDYSAYAAKHIEELEHMVELYDFPATLETHDIISVFSELNSDSMYVKWVDDTHAILVLGSLTQAQKAIELSNSLIKVRPMSTASSLTLEKAYQSDLKPAMKRPQTNLLTARRLITSHLGAKSKASREQTVKEREDLRIAKELKKKAKQNEKDAWEGNLQSTVN